MSKYLTITPQMHCVHCGAPSDLVLCCACMERAEERQRTVASTFDNVTATEVIAIGESDYAIVLPPEIIQHLGMSVGDDIAMTISDGEITIRKAAR